MELPEEDQPIEEIWLDPERLASHFEDVRDRWRSGSGSEGKWEKIEDAPMTDNDLAREWRK